MKKIVYLVLLPCMIALSSCVTNEEDIFEESASIRMQKVLKIYKELLVGATDGWYADYYPEVGAKIGGYAMHFKFYENGFADVSCEINTNAPAREVHTSQYEFIADKGSVLSFNTYNPVLHYFSEPNSSDYDGLMGDYEFVVMSAKQDTIELEGKKHGNKLILRRNTGHDDPKDHLTQIETLSGVLSDFGMFSFMLKGTRIGMASVLNRTFSIGYTVNTNGVEQQKTVSVSYTFTPTGIRLYEPFVFNGVTMQNFVWMPEEEKYRCTDPGVDAIFDVFFPEDYELRYDEMIGTWRMEYHGASTTAWTYADIEITQKTRNLTYTVSAPTASTFPFELSFNAQKGTVSFFVHNIGVTDSEGYTIRACIYARANGMLNTSVGSTVGIVGMWNHDEGGVRKINFVDNGRWVTYKANGIILRMYNGTTSMGNFIGNVADYRLSDITITKISQ